MATPQKPISATERKRREKQATTAQAWRQGRDKMVELPSGNHAVLRRPGMDKFLSAGYLPDTLRSVIQEQISGGSGRRAQELTKDLSLDETAEWMSAMDRIAVQVFVQPALRWHKKPSLGQDGKPLLDPQGQPLYVELSADERDPEALYTDEVDMEDKQFAFQYAVGGDTDLERFREATASAMADLSAGSDVAMPPERSAVPDGSVVADPVER